MILAFVLCRPKATAADDFSDDDFKYLTNNEKVLLGGIMTKKSSGDRDASVGDLESNPEVRCCLLLHLPRLLVYAAPHSIIGFHCLDLLAGIAVPVPSVQPSIARRVARARAVHVAA